MSESSLDDIVRLTDRLYEAVYDDSRWTEVMDDLKAQLSASSGAFGFVDTRSSAMHMLFAECQPGFGEQYYDPALANPFVPRSFSAPAGDILIDQSIMPRAELERTIFFNEWLRPQGEHSVLNVKLLAQGNMTAHLMVLRSASQPAFDERDISLARKILPTFRRVACRLYRGARRGLSATRNPRQRQTTVLASISGFIAMMISLDLGFGRHLWVSAAELDQLLGRPLPRQIPVRLSPAVGAGSTSDRRRLYSHPAQGRPPGANRST